MSRKFKEIVTERFGSLNRFAAASGMHPTTVSLIANGRLQPGPTQIEKIVDALGWEEDAAQLFADSGDEEDA